MKVAIIYSSLIAESICSAAIAAMKHGDIVSLDIETASKEEIEDGLARANKLFVFADDFEIPEFEEIEGQPKPEVFYLEESVKATKDDVKQGVSDKEGDTLKKRVLTVWEKLFPGQVRPLAVHYLGNYQLTDKDKLNRLFFRHAVTTYLFKLTGTEMARWRPLLGVPNQDVDLLNKFLRSGKAIYDYLARGFGGDESDNQISEETERLSETIGGLEVGLKDSKKENVLLRAKLEQEGVKIPAAGTEWLKQPPSKPEETETNTEDSTSTKTEEENTEQPDGDSSGLGTGDEDKETPEDNESKDEPEDDGPEEDKKSESKSKPKGKDK